MKYVIIGNGIAGLSAAQTIRKFDPQGSIKIISSEKYLTYYRVKLSHFISKRFEDEELLLNKKQWYDENHIAVDLGVTVEALNPDQKELQLSDGKKIFYDKLLIATGSHPFVPPVAGAQMPGVFALRTLEDLKSFQHYLENCQTVTVIGGGLLGLEAAWAIKELGKKVNVVEFFPYLLPRQLDEEISKVFTEKLQQKDLHIYTNTAVEAILGEEKVTGLALKGGQELQTDAVLFSAGIRPNLDLAKSAALDVDKGIKVDHQMKSNLKDIFAAGDTIQIEGNILGLWNTASDQGKVAGENMTGGSQRYQPSQLSTLLNIGGLSVFSIGDVQDFTDTFSTFDGEARYRFYAKDGILTGGVVINNMSKVPKVKKAVLNKISIAEELGAGKSQQEIVDGLLQ
ncbi:pyridine nucleotide-disulfide oxidoreductase [Clostridium aceticum]|nr:pyridine nucleotide-disulfide oxidoreductase [Clostridium aceticum]